MFLRLSTTPQFLSLSGIMNRYHWEDDGAHRGAAQLSEISECLSRSAMTRTGRESERGIHEYFFGSYVYLGNPPSVPESKTLICINDDHTTN